MIVLKCQNYANYLLSGVKKNSEKWREGGVILREQTREMLVQIESLSTGW